VIRLVAVAVLVGGYGAWWLPRQGAANEPEPGPADTRLAGCSGAMIQAPGENNASTPLIVEVAGAAYAPGAPVQLGIDLNQPHQRWWRCPTRDGYALLRPRHAPDLCMTEAEAKDLARVHTQPCQGLASQEWRGHDRGTDDLGRAYTSLMNRADGRVIDIDNNGFRDGSRLKVFHELSTTRWDQLLRVNPA